MKKKNRNILIIILSLLVAVVVLGLIYSHYGGFGTGKCADTEAFSQYAGTLDDISIPEHVRIIALGEATHGNAEFQQLKLDVFKRMVEKQGVRRPSIVTSTVVTGQRRKPPPPSDFPSTRRSRWNNSLPGCAIITSLLARVKTSASTASTCS